MYARAARVYRKVDHQSLSKVQLLDRLFSRLLRDMEDAGRAIRENNLADKSAKIDHAIRIVTELSAALDSSVAPELCQNLAALYDYANDQLELANRDLSPQPLANAASVISNLRESFRLAGAA